jgi:hypothetical protein
MNNELKKRNIKQKSITHVAETLFSEHSLIVIAIAIEMVRTLRIVVRAAKNDLLTHKL